MCFGGEDRSACDTLTREAGGARALDHRNCRAPRQDRERDRSDEGDSQRRNGEPPNHGIGSPRNGPPSGGVCSYALLLRGSSFALRYSRPSGPSALTCVMYSPDFAQWKWGVWPGRMITAPGGYACNLLASNTSPSPM